MQKVIALDAHAIVDVEDAYDHMRQPSPDHRDMIIRAINRATAKLEGLCNREIVTRDRTERIDGSGLREIWMRQYPVHTVTAMAWWDYSNSIKTALNLKNIYIGEAGFVKLSVDYFPLGFKNIEVTYNAGFDPSSTPLEYEKLRGYCLDLVVMYYQRWTGQRGELQSMTAGTASESFTDKDVPAYIAQGLATDGLIRIV